MFSGIIEAVSPCVSAKASSNNLQLTLKRPKSFKSLQEGASIAVDGICLTLESFNSQKMVFSLGPETLSITGWNAKNCKNKELNLERSLSLQSALGGHIMTGHIDGLAQVKKLKRSGKSRYLSLSVPKEYRSYFVKKGYIGLNGVSLTVNDLHRALLEICLIPKTLEMSNLSLVKQGDFLNFEVDYLFRMVLQNLQK